MRAAARGEAEGREDKVLRSITVRQSARADSGVYTCAPVCFENNYSRARRVAMDAPLFNTTEPRANGSAQNQHNSLLPTGVKITIVVVYMVVCVLGLVGNCLVMYVNLR
ncbi:nociceptin receptor-like [Arapaima gigas]